MWFNIHPYTTSPLHTKQRVHPSVNPQPSLSPLTSLPPHYQPSKWGQIVFFNRIDLYHSLPDFGERQYISKIFKKAI